MIYALRNEAAVRFWNPGCSVLVQSLQERLSSFCN